MMTTLTGRQRLRPAGRRRPGSPAVLLYSVVMPSPAPRSLTGSLAVWTIVIATAVALSARLPSVLQGGADAIPGSGSDRVTRMIRARFGAGTLYQFPVVVHTDALDSTDPAFAAAIERLTASLAAVPSVARVESPWNAARAELLG